MNSRHRRLLRLVALSAVLALPGLLWPAPAGAQATTTTDNATVPIDFIATSCTGETVIISGESHVVTHLTSTPGGHSTLKIHIQFHLSGESASGTRYVANETVNSTETSSAGGAHTVTSIGQLHLISQGSADNLVVRTTLHTTVNANGEITSTNFEFETDCQG